MRYALEGNVFVAGAAAQRLCDGLWTVDNVAFTETYANKAPDNADVCVVSAFVGLGASY